MATKKNINENLDELKEIFKGNKIALSLVNEAEFMKNTLKKLKATVDEEGCIVSMQQGKYVIDVENPALRSYNVTIRNYNTVIKQINDMLPKDLNIEADDGFDCL